MQTPTAASNLGNLSSMYGSIHAAIAGVHAASFSGEVECLSFGGNTHLLQYVVGGVAASTSSVIELMGVHTLDPGVVLA